MTPKENPLTEPKKVKGFPKKKYLFFTDGWEDLGLMDEFREDSDKITALHKFCMRRVRIGKEKGKLFKFCPRCLVKIDEKITH
jgi:hypothetical protein